ncbi:MAG TPA: sugar ABC transporter permease, partial [Candidatus Limnocylindria bacterium]
MRTRTGQLLPFTLLLPSIAFLVVLIVVPMAEALLLSVGTESDGFSLETFQRMLANVNFSDAWRNTFLVLLLIVPLQVALALAMALLVNSRFRGHRWFFLIYTVPLAVSDLAAGLLWLAAFTERG